jgi:hypothetical protein
MLPLQARSRRELIMRVATAIFIGIAVALIAAGCRIGPLVDDKPGASTHLLPAGADVPSVADTAKLVGQITVNDGIDDRAVTMNGGVLPRGTGWSAGQQVHYWAFGAATRAPSPLFRFYRRDDSGLTPLDHPPLVDSLPGDPTYSPLHSISNVVVTDAYNGELITSTEALNDALDLGLIEQPALAGTFMASPVVLPDTKLDAGPMNPQVAPGTAYARGYTVGLYQFGGSLGVQPMNSLLPISQVSFLRGKELAYDTQRPIFQTTMPKAPPGKTANYTPLSVVVDVDLVPDREPADIKQDSDLFDRSKGTTTENVQQAQVTPTLLLLPMQFTEGEL